MLHIGSFEVGESALIYRGRNEYFVFDRGEYVQLVVDVMDGTCENVIDTRYLERPSVSLAIAVIEAMESGEEVNE